MERYLEKQRLGTLDQIERCSGRPRRVTFSGEQQLVNQLKEHQDVTLTEHARMREYALGLQVSCKTVDRVFRRYWIAHKQHWWPAN
ncbi:hypothetical protein [Deinococcus aerolatus]|uniref:hypothetical protein n=1 Tax=Deinococcus aerolatus TaxID=522487 RepID=UPI001664C9C0|nr:hypothetical protein [Deinococcus aerolatus]